MPPGSSPAFRRNGRKSPHPPSAPKPVDVSDLDGLSPEELARRLAPEALQELAVLIRGEGSAIRHATAKLGAIRELLSYGVAKPAAAIAVSGPGGGPVQSKHTIEFVSVPKTEQ